MTYGAPGRHAVASSTSFEDDDVWLSGEKGTARDCGSRTTQRGAGVDGCPETDIAGPAPQAHSSVCAHSNGAAEERRMWTARCAVMV